MTFTELTPAAAEYHCSGINAIHQCERDPNTWDRYSKYRNKDPTVREQGAVLMANGIRAGQAAAFLNSQHRTRIQGKDIHHIVQMNIEGLQSLGDAGLTPNESQHLLEVITNAGNQYHIKFRDNSQVMDCIFYWDPTDIQLTHHFSQVCLLHLNIIDGRFFKSIPHLKTTFGASHCLRLLLQLMK